MPHLERIDEGLDVSDLREQILAQPHLWNAHPGRTSENSPHYGVPDIWVRYRAADELVESHHFREPHFGCFYPAWYALPALHPITFGLMAKLKAVYLGGILITKIPPGGQVKPHDDRGSWHAHFCNAKLYVPVTSNPGCINRVLDEEATFQPGEVWRFNNLLQHSVENRGETDRITAIICFRVEP